MADKYIYLKGQVGLFEKDPVTGVTGKGLFLGNCPDGKLTLKVDTIDHFESQSGTNALDRQVVKTIGAEVSLTLENLSKENAALLVWGTNVALAALTSQSFTLPGGVAVGENYRIPSGFNLSNITVQDSAGTPVTVTSSKYTVDTKFGIINFNNIGTYTQPFKVNYDRGTGDSIPFFTGERPVRYLQFQGINLGNPGETQKNLVLEVFNVVFDPIADFPFLNDDFAKFELKGSALIDPVRALDNTLGQFGRMAHI